jgi:hypothetical protein
MVLAMGSSLGSTIEENNITTKSVAGISLESPTEARITRNTIATSFNVKVIRAAMRVRAVATDIHSIWIYENKISKLTRFGSIDVG